MASLVHFKLKSAKTFDSVNFHGMSIRVLDLKLAIAAKKFSGEARDFDLQIQNAHTNEVYTKDDALVPKNSEVIVKRIPANGKGLLQSVLGSTSRVGAAAAQALAQGSSVINVGGSSSSNLSGEVDSQFAQHMSSVGRTAQALAASAGVSEDGGGHRNGWRGGGGKGGKGSGKGGWAGGEEADTGPRHLKGVPLKLQRIDAETNEVKMLANDDKFQVARDFQAAVAGEGAGAVEGRNGKASGMAGRRFGGMDFGPQGAPSQFVCPLCERCMDDAVVMQWLLDTGEDDKNGSAANAALKTPPVHSSSCEGCIRESMTASDSVCPFTGKKIRGYQDKLLPNRPLRAQIATFASDFAAGRTLQQRQQRDQEAAAAAAAAAASGDAPAAGALARPEGGTDATLVIGKPADREGFSGSGGGNNAATAATSSTVSNGGVGMTSQSGGVSGGLYDDFGDDDEEGGFAAAAAAAEAVAAERNALEFEASEKQRQEREQRESGFPAAGAPPLPPGPRPPPGPPPGAPPGLSSGPPPGISQPPSSNQRWGGGGCYGCGGGPCGGGGGGGSGPGMSNHSNSRSQGGREACRDFAKGRCQRGHACIYSHDNMGGGGCGGMPPMGGAPPDLYSSGKGCGGWRGTGPSGMTYNEYGGPVMGKGGGKGSGYYGPADSGDYGKGGNGKGCGGGGGGWKRGREWS